MAAKKRARKEPEKKPEPKPAAWADRYRVLFCVNYDDLNAMVNEHMDKGWRCTGGIAINTKGFYQAVVKG